jgi:serine/threonine protein kinase
MNTSVLSTVIKVGSAAKRSQRRRIAEEPGLSRELIACLHKSNFHDPEQGYFPIGLVKQLISPTSVEKEFRRCSDAAKALDEELENNNALIDRMCCHSYRTLATAIFCGLEKLPLLDFMIIFQDEKGLSDEDLPDVAEDTIQECCFGNTVKAHSFYTHRWMFLAPIFSPQKYDYDLPSDCIFPFEKDVTISRSGAFGTVSRVKIHSDHQKHMNMQYVSRKIRLKLSCSYIQVAVKEIQIPQDKEMLATDKAWDDEAKALRNINKLNHPNITQCIAAVRRGGRRYFVFSWAEGGNLQEYWKKVAKQTPDAKSIRQMVEQLRGVTDALDALHNCKSGDKNLLAVPNSGMSDNEKSIRHGDLKPENILRFISRLDTKEPHTDNELGTLKIADMGLAKQHIVATQLRTNTSQRYGTIRYEAPEAITETKGRSRLYDVWSLGCITLEFIIWVLYGNDILEEFYTQVEAGRKQTCQYFELHEDRKGAEVHHIVIAWMKRIRISDPECSQDTAIGDLLETVRNRLLVVNLEPGPTHRKDSAASMPSAGRSTSSFRATAAEYRHDLDAILEKAKRSPTYLFTDKSRDGIRLPKRTDFLSPATSQRKNLTMNQRSYDANAGKSFGITGRQPRLEYSVSCLFQSASPTHSILQMR